MQKTDMSAIEISPITSLMTIRFGGDKVLLPADLRQKVDQHWQQLVQANPRLHNGEAFTVVAVNKTAETLDIELAQTDYAHYLYSQQIGGLGEFMVRIIHSATLVVTADNTLVFGAMGIHTSLSGIIQCCGGGIDHNDITNGIVDIEHNTARELAEELGLNAYDTQLVGSFTPTYLKTGGPTEKMTLVYVLRLKQSSGQFLQHYQAFVKQLEQNNEEPEFGKIFCVAADRQSVETFIQESENQLNEYMPGLLRAVVQA